MSKAAQTFQTCVFLLVWTTQALASEPANNVVFAVIGDFGMQGIAEQQVAAAVHALAPDFIVTSGDNNYPKGERSTLDKNIGAYYHDFIAFGRNSNSRFARKGATRNLFFPVLGNHDWYGKEAIQPYLDYFDLPGTQRYYQIRQGPVALFMLDSDKHEPDGTSTDSKQALWLRTAMQQSQAPWKIVIMHHPPYSRGPHGNCTTMQWPFKAWGAHWVIAGHDHHYERTVIDDLTYSVIGNGGAELRDVVHPAPQAASFNQAITFRYGTVLVRATTASLTATLYDTALQPLDSFAWYK